MFLTLSLHHAIKNNHPKSTELTRSPTCTANIVPTLKHIRLNQIEHERIEMTRKDMLSRSFFSTNVFPATIYGNNT